MCCEPSPASSPEMPADRGALCPRGQLDFRGASVAVGPKRRETVCGRSGSHSLRTLEIALRVAVSEALTCGDKTANSELKTRTSHRRGHGGEPLGPRVFLWPQFHLIKSGGQLRWSASLLSFLPLKLTHGQPRLPYAGRTGASLPAIMVVLAFGCSLRPGAWVTVVSCVSARVSFIACPDSCKPPRPPVLSGLLSG